MYTSEQLLLPVEIRPEETVYWFNAEQKHVRRRFFSQKLVTRLLIDPNTDLPATTEVRVDKIHQLKDPNLRYALRFMAVVEAIGWEQRTPGWYSRHDVSVTATDEGVNSRLIGAVYSGMVSKKEDAFMDTLHSFEHSPEVHELPSVNGSSETDGSRSRYWVRPANVGSKS